MYPARKKRSPLPFFISFVAFLILTIIIGLVYLQTLKDPVDENGTPQQFTIESGESVTSIAQRLEEVGLIRSALMFRIQNRFFTQTHVEAGNFTLSPAMTLDEVMATLSKGTMDEQVKLLEGWRIEEMAAELNAKLGIDKEEFLANAEEGYMFPDTYQIHPTSDASDIAKMLKDTFKSRYTEELQRQIQAKGLTPEEGVILASIVEREARSDEVRTAIAGIYLKRLNMGMKLDADATVQYALGYNSKEKSWWTKGLTLDDLKIDSPYNTYTNPGLPPTPIANPSLSSLKAVANANPNTPYLYYFHDSKGNTYYAKTLEEQNANASRYR